ncbi:unnamed protein product [Ectocarpus sp. 8 AP-2014]
MDRNFRWLWRRCVILVNLFCLVTAPAGVQAPTVLFAGVVVARGGGVTADERAPVVWSGDVYGSSVRGRLSVKTAEKSLAEYTVRWWSLSFSRRTAWLHQHSLPAPMRKYC